MRIFVTEILLSVIITTVANYAVAASESVVETNSGELIVTANYKNATQGTVHFAVYTDEDKFLSTPFVVAEAALVDGSARVVFPNLPWDEYAVSAYLDLDADDELDSVWFGAPAEPVGTSNDAKGSFGPPDYADARFMFETASLAIEFTLECPVGCK